MEQEWVNEPRLYIKGEKGYVLLWKKDGTNVLYRVGKQTSGALKGMWKIVDVKREKINRIPVPNLKRLLTIALPIFSNKKSRPPHLENRLHI